MAIVIKLLNNAFVMHSGLLMYSKQTSEDESVTVVCILEFADMLLTENKRNHKPKSFNVSPNANPNILAFTLILT